MFPYSFGTDLPLHWEYQGKNMTIQNYSNNLSLLRMKEDTNLHTWCSVLGTIDLVNFRCLFCVSTDNEVSDHIVKVKI